MRARVDDAPVTAATSGIPRSRVLLAAAPAVALALAAVNLRPAMASFGSLLDDVRDGLGMSAGTAGLLTSMPAACFAVLGSLTPALVRRAGLQAVVSWALFALGVGLAARPFLGGETGFFALSALGLAAIAVGNVAMPAVVRQVFPHRIGTMTGLYSMALTAGAALSAATSVPIAHAFGGWQTGLAVWCVPAFAAAALWVVAMRRRAARPVAAVTPVSSGAGVRELARSGTAWALTVFFGLQAAGAYIVLGWLPEIYRDAGLSSGSAGLLLALTPTVGVPFAFLMPALAARLGRQSELAVGLSAVGLLGYAGLWLAPATVPWMWAVLLGISQASFPLALAMIGLRAGAGGVVTLSAFVQGFGYLISVPCPAVVGLLVQHTGGWGAPLSFMAGLLVVQAVVGAVAGRGRPA